MKAVSAALLALVCFLPLAASAQWQWLDKDGRKVFSDQMPPPDVPPNRIVRSPAGARIADVEAPAASAAAASALPKPTGNDKALDEKRKQLAAAEADRKKADEAKVAAARTENCSRARTGKANFDSGMRIARVNEKGEREVMDDAQRAAELKVLNEVIARDCGKQAQ